MLSLASASIIVDLDIPWPIRCSCLPYTGSLHVSSRKPYQEVILSSEARLFLLLYSFVVVLKLVFAGGPLIQDYP